MIWTYIASFVGLVAPLAALFIVLEALSYALPGMMERLRIRFSPDTLNRTLTMAPRILRPTEGGVAPTAGRNLHPEHAVRSMTSRPIRQAA